MNNSHRNKTLTWSLGRATYPVYTINKWSGTWCHYKFWAFVVLSDWDTFVWGRKSTAML